MRAASTMPGTAAAPAWRPPGPRMAPQSREWRRGAADGDEIDCVMLDLTMPRMDGETCLRELRARRPDLPVILSSGFNEQEISSRFASQDLAGFVQKPYHVKTLAAALRAALGPPAR